MDHDKNSLRQQMEEASLSIISHPGKIAEALRRQDVYRQSKTIFVSPAPLLSQVRINALLDGKTLLVPGPGIKKGFYLLKPYVIPFKDLGHGVALKGIEQYGKILTMKKLQELHIELALTDCLTVDSGGGRLGYGTGFFDLAMGILSDIGAVDKETLFGALGVHEQMASQELPQDSWDVRLNFLVTMEGLTPLFCESQELQVIWDVLEKKRIRKLEPLWQLYQQRFSEGSI